MKNYVILTLSLVLGVSTVFAHTPEEQKIDAIKRIYQEAQNKKLDVLDQNMLPLPLHRQSPVKCVMPTALIGKITTLITVWSLPQN